MPRLGLREFTLAEGTVRGEERGGKGGRRGVPGLPMLNSDVETCEENR